MSQPVRPYAGLLFDQTSGLDDVAPFRNHAMAVVPITDILPDSAAPTVNAATVVPSVQRGAATGGVISSLPQAMGAASTAAGEVAFISGVNADGTLALQSFASWNDGTIPADYGGGYTNALKWGGNTAGTAGGTVTYYFDPSSNWTATEQSWLAGGLAMWSAITNISFVATTDATGAGITFKRGSDGKADTATKVSGGSDAGRTGGTVLWGLTGATISIDTSVGGFGPISGDFSSYGGYAILTFLHEEGHAIGLGHAGPYNGDVNTATQQFSAYDSMLSSIMSYIDPRDKTAAYYASYPVQNTSWGQSGGYGDVPTTWMPLDILAAQRLYGLPTTTPLSGGQTFGFNCTVTGAIEPFFDFTKNSKPVITLWDLGTGNTLDLSGFSSSDTISLIAGTYSSIANMTNNIAIAFGTAIDTLICSAGSATVTCNNDGDTVYGGMGNDIIFVGGGTSVLKGGAGLNTVSFANFATGVTVDLSLTTAQTPAAGSSVALSNFQSLTGSNYNDTLSATGMFAARISGGDGDDTINVTNAPATVVDGGNGNDTINLVNSHGATIDGGAGMDTLVYDASASTGDVVQTWNLGSSQLHVLPDGSVYQNIETLALKTGSGNDTLTFKDPAGNITWDGGAGNDTAIIDDSDNSYMVTTVGVTFTNVEHYTVMAGSGGASLTFYSNGGTLIGGSNSNWLNTAATGTTFIGGASADTLIDTGSDTTFDGGGGDFDRFFIDRSSMTADISLTFTPGSSTPVVLPDGTNFKNVEAIVLKTGTGNDSVTFNNPTAPQGYLLNSWDGGAGYDVATVLLDSDTAGVTAAVSSGRYTVTRSYSGSLTDVLTLYNVEALHFTTGSGNDVLTSGAGNDVFNGGLGVDTVVYSGARAAYSISRAGLTTTVSGPDGTDTLTGIEKLQFSDGTLSLPTAVADANGDGNSDIYWQNSDGTPAIWTMNGLTQLDGSPVGGNPGASWHMVGTGDFNGDGTADILWQNDSGQADIWTVNGFTLLNGAMVGGNPGPSWHIKGTGDFNGDGKSDILWQNDDGQAAIWTMNGLTQLGGAEIGNPGADWHIKGTGDFNGDGKTDILWQNDNGQAAIWLMDGFGIASGSTIGGNPGTSWHVIGAGDFDGDGKSDILWQSDSGQAAVWTMNGLTQTGGSPVGGNPGASWHVIGAGDYNGDGYADILWQNDNGQAAIWTMQGFTQLGGAMVGGNPGTSWHIVS